jgi:hypothetical protein
VSQSKKNIVLLISFGVLCLVSVVLYWSSTTVTEEIDPTLFRLQDSKTVNKVVFQKDTSGIVLEFNNGKWIVNKIFEADLDLVDVLFATVAQAIPKREVAASIRDSVARESKQQGVKVEFYVGEKVDRTFWVLGDETQGVTYFTDNEENISYVMVIPGYRVFVAGIFTQGANMWRDKRIFNFNWRNFTGLTATFPNDPVQNFKVAMTDRFFSVEGMPNIDTTALNNYLDAVSLIEGDAFYEPGQATSYDSLIKTKPIMSIRVQELSGEEYLLEVYGIAKDERNALARWGDDYVWFDRRNILQLYKKRKDFVKQPQP